MSTFSWENYESELWMCSCWSRNASCQTIAEQCLRCSEKFMFFLCVVARVFWVVARWLLTSLSPNNSWVSDILVTRYCLVRSFNRNLRIIFAHFILQQAEIVSLMAKCNCTVTVYINCTWKVIELCLQQIPQLFVSVMHEDLHTKV